ncbi:type III pantothenate kinase [bacterium]|nr:type III pantothenate kinase [bacterium]
MLLVVDIGNTETVLGLYEKDVLKAHWRLSSQGYRTSDECWILLNMWCESSGMTLSSIKGVVISSVVPFLTSVFEEISRNHIGIEPLSITAEIDTGLRILYETPRTVGADRICNAVAGYTHYGGPLIVVDFGTATTFDVVSEKGEYIGGVIALGLTGASQELHRVAAKLPRVDLIFPPFVVGKTTETSMQSGIMWGTVVLVDGVVNKIIAEMGWNKVGIIATGGLSSLVAVKSQTIQKIDPFLTLEGMRLIFKRLSRRHL